MVAGNGRPPQGRRAGKAARAGLPKKQKHKKSGQLSSQAPSSSGGRVVDLGGTAANVPRKWTAAEKRARAAERAAERTEAGEEEEEHASEEEEETAAVGRRPKASASQHGSHFGHGASGRVNDEWQTTAEAWSELVPCLEHWRSARVWMPFWYDGMAAKHLRALGFKHVLHEDADFFERAQDAEFLSGVDVIVDNPPYTNAETKEAVLTALMATGTCFHACVCARVTVRVVDLRHERQESRGVSYCRPACCSRRSSARRWMRQRRVFQPAARHNAARRTAHSTPAVYSTLTCADTLQVQLVLPRRLKVCKTDGPPVPFKQMLWLCHGCKLALDLNFVGE